MGRIDRRVPQWVVEGVGYDELVTELLWRAFERTGRRDPLDSFEDPHLTDGQHALLAIELLERSRMMHGWYAAVRAHRPIVVSGALWGADTIGADAWAHAIQHVVDEVFGPDWPPADDDVEDRCWARFDGAVPATGAPNPSHPGCWSPVGPDSMDGERDDVAAADGGGPIFRWATHSAGEPLATTSLPTIDSFVSTTMVDDRGPTGATGAHGSSGEAVGLPWDREHETLLELIVHYVVTHREELFTPPAHGREHAAERMRYLDELLAREPRGELDERTWARAMSWSDAAPSAARATGRRGLQRAAQLQRAHVESLRPSG